MKKLAALLVAVSLTLSAASVVFAAYEGQPGNQSNGGKGGSGNTGYEGQPGNQSSGGK